MEKLKLYYDVNFVINNQQILDAHYTGKFRTHDGIEHVIRVLASIINLPILKITRAIR